MKPIVVNFYAGPGAGKSTMASALHAHLKFNGITSEYIHEYAKDLVYLKNHNILQDPVEQPFISATQLHWLNRVKDNADIIITDSPPLLGAAYMVDNNWSEDFSNFLHSFVRNEYININFWVKRVKPYVRKGRGQTAEEAKELDDILKNKVLDPHGICYEDIEYGLEESKKIADRIVALNVEVMQKLSPGHYTLSGIETFFG